MSNLTVDSKVDTFMQATASEGMQKALLDTSAAICLPIVIAFKNITVLTSGAPADLASVTLPTWVTRYASVQANGFFRAIAESASGTLAGASIQVFTGTGGTGTNITGSLALPTVAGVMVTGAGNTSFGTSGTIYLRQTANSANAGVISVYLTIIPCL